MQSTDYLTSDSEADAQIVGLGAAAEGSHKLCGTNKKRKRRETEESWNLLFSSLTLQECDVHHALKGHVFKYTLKGSGKVLKCNLHKNCQHEMRIKKMHVESSETLFDVHERGEHDTDEFAGKVSGLNPLILEIADPILCAGTMPSVATQEVREILQQSPEGRALWDGMSEVERNMLHKKICNRKRTLTGTKVDRDTPLHLNRFLMERELNLEHDDTSVQRRLQELVAQYGKEDLICCARFPLKVGSSLLRCTVPIVSPPVAASSSGPSVVSAQPSSDDVTVDSSDAVMTVPRELSSHTAAAAAHGTDSLDIRGYAFTSGALLQNLHVAMRDQTPGVSLSVDGTYRLVTCKWPLVVVGTHTVNHPTANTNRDSRSSHTLIPILFALVSSESEHMYRSVLGVLKAAATKLFAVTLSVQSAAQDRAQAIKNAQLGVFGKDVHIVNCWPHFIRKARERAVQLKIQEYFSSTIEPQLHAIHHAPTHYAFTTLVAAAQEEWTAAGQGKFAEWLQKYYYDDGWDGWWCGAAGVAGAGPTNNPIEGLSTLTKS